jgi:hypothetical protein
MVGYIDLPTWAYSRFGFVCDTSGTSYHRLEFDGMEEVPPPWIDICKNMAYDRLQNDVPSAIQDPLSDFVSALLIIGHAPGLLWDLNVCSAHFLGNRTNPVIRVARRMISNQVLYFLEPIHTNNQPFQLAVPDAATALQCLRETWGPHVEDIIRQLLRLGIPFTTRVPGPEPDSAISSRRPVVLGYREVGYKPDSVDYAEYETIRRAFCESEQHSRAALLKGGIVWRLVKETLSPGDVLAGPTANVCCHGHALTSPNNQSLWDDDLSEDELDMICGVYKIFTGNFIRVNLAHSLTFLVGQSSQTSHSSWWPKHSVWMRSPMNVGYWSPAAEHWFQRRLDSIRCGSAHLKNSSEWNHSLKIHRKTKKLSASNETAASMYLDDYEFRD